MVPRLNPIAQAERFDADAAYVRKWVPEHGTASYPKPIVEHTFARNRLLAAAKAHLAVGDARRSD